MKNKKRILTTLTASVLSLSALSSFTASAENESSVSSYDNITEKLMQNLDEYMSEKDCEKASDKFSSLYSRRPYLNYSEEYTKYIHEAVYFENYDNCPDSPGVWTFTIDPTYVDLYCEFSEGNSFSDINSYINEKHPEYKNLHFNGNILNIRTYRTSMAENVDVKGLITELKNNGMIETAELRYGEVQGRSRYAGHYIEPISWFRATDFSSSIAEEFITTKQDILDYYAAGKLDCEFGIIVVAEKMPEGVEYIPFEEKYDNEQFEMIGGSYYGYMALTPEDAAGIDQELIDAVEYFSAVPHENTLENQINLLYEINKDIYIDSNNIGYLDDNVKDLSLTAITVDVTNYLNGDANCDQKYSIADSTAILQALGNPDKYGLSDLGLFNADSTGDGLTVEDAVAIKTALAKGIE